MKHVFLVTTIAAAGAALVAAATLVAPPNRDWSRLPPLPSQVYETLVAAGGRLAPAIAKIEEKLGGVAANAMIDLREGPPRMLIELYTREAHHRVSIDASSGEVLEDEIIPRIPGGAVTGEPQESASGLQWYEIVVGDGPEPPGSTARVRVHYSGWLVDGTKFDSSVDRGEPAVFALNQVIPGWTEGVGSMKVGGKRKLIVPHTLAYGPAGRGGRIPPSATLVFDVELLEILE